MKIETESMNQPIHIAVTIRKPGTVALLPAVFSMIIGSLAGFGGPEGSRPDRPSHDFASTAAGASREEMAAR